MVSSNSADSLDSFKRRFHDDVGVTIARLSNAIWNLEVLQGKGDEVLPEADAAKFRSAIVPMINSLDNAKGMLLTADGQVDEIRISDYGASYE